MLTNTVEASQHEGIDPEELLYSCWVFVVVVFCFWPGTVIQHIRPEHGFRIKTHSYFLYTSLTGKTPLSEL